MFFSRKRRDGILVRPKETYALILPHLFKTRAESIVLYPMVIDVDAARAFLREKRNQGHELSMFHLVSAACVRCMHDFPNIQRFVAGRRMYLHKEAKISYTIKHAMALSATETTVCQPFELTDTVYDVARRMNEGVEAARKDIGGTGEEKIISLVQNLPRFLLKWMVSLAMWMDYHDILPKAFMDALPFYCTVFMANLGSLGMNAPLHHLYEIGTCSVFMAMGRINRENYLKPDGTVAQRATMQVNWSVDERIVDGFYLSRVLRNFEHLLKHPELLEEPPKEG